MLLYLCVKTLCLQVIECGAKEWNRAKQNMLPCEPMEPIVLNVIGKEALVIKLQNDKLNK